ncbi:hypothetical protein LINGRAHAP2_LOCUS30872 [Linum grandiflorum]
MRVLFQTLEAEDIDGQVDWMAKNSDGAFGGLQVAWDTSKYLICGQWFGRFSAMVILESVSDGSRWCLVNYYGPCERNLKEEFMAELRVIGQWWQMPICFVGDFNLIHNSLCGRSFTWTNFQANPTMSRLDRVLINSDWKTRFPDCTITVLLRVYSDHNSVMIVAGRG